MLYGFECTYDTQINRRAESIKSKKSVSSRLNVGFRVATALGSTFVSPASSQLGLGMWPQIQIMKKIFSIILMLVGCKFCTPSRATASPSRVMAQKHDSDEHNTWMLLFALKAAFRPTTGKKRRRSHHF